MAVLEIKLGSSTSPLFLKIIITSRFHHSGAQEGPPPLCFHSPSADLSAVTGQACSLFSTSILQAESDSGDSQDLPPVSRGHSQEQVKYIYTHWIHATLALESARDLVHGLSSSTLAKRHEITLSLQMMKLWLAFSYGADCTCLQSQITTGLAL